MRALDAQRTCSRSTSWCTATRCRRPWAAAASPATSSSSRAAGASPPDPAAAWHLLVGDLERAARRSPPRSSASPPACPVHVLVGARRRGRPPGADHPRRPARHVAAGRRRRHRAARGGQCARVPGRAGARLRPRRGGRPSAPSAAISWSSARSRARRWRPVSGYWKRTRTEGGWREDQGGVEPPGRAGRGWLTHCAGASGAAPILAPVAKHEHPQASMDWASAEVKAATSRSRSTVRRTPSGPNACRPPSSASIGPGAPGRLEGGEGEDDRRGGHTGAEEDLRHLLDGAVQQANADFAPAGRRRRGGPSRRTAAMTEAFRAFAGDDAQPEGTESAPGASAARAQASATRSSSAIASRRSSRSSASSSRSSVWVSQSSRRARVASASRARPR